MKVEGLEPGVIIRAQKDRIRDLELETTSLRQVVERLKGRRWRLPPWRGTRLHPLRARAGMTLVEVLMGMALFMVGMTGIIALFATATRLHYEGSARRTATWIAESTLAEVRMQPGANLYAKTELTDPVTASDTALPVVATVPDGDNPRAQFQRWPWWTRDFTDSRRAGMLLVGGEWMWSDALTSDSFDDLERGVWGSAQAHAAGTRVVQVREWVLAYRDMPARDRLEVYGDPTALPIPAQGYVEVERTWMQYSGFDATGFDIVLQRDLQGLATLPTGQVVHIDHPDGLPDQGVGLTPEPLPNPQPAGGAFRPVAVNVARPVDEYPDCWRAISLMPTTNATAGTRLWIDVATERGGRLGRVWQMEGVYFPER
ncbi:MAG TPA: hypothetical protein VNA25_17190 [Phycisphaerae bacterium]|nr:hypothetical protein [Phycisphaerae bacterium]